MSALENLEQKINTEQLRFPFNREVSFKCYMGLQLKYIDFLYDRVMFDSQMSKSDFTTEIYIEYYADEFRQKYGYLLEE
jgi:hypothetical protein